MTTTDHRQSGHEAITEDLILLIDHDDELKRLLLKSIQQAHTLNPDPDSNPVDSLESYYDFLDRSYKAMPWAITKDGNYHKLYDLIDQSMGCFYFVCDQPLEELEDRGYYHNSLMYHEPFRSWLIRFMSQYGFYLNEEISWNEEYYKNALQNPDFHLDDDTYEDPSNWKCFNDFFARRLKDPSRRPIASPEDPSVIVFPADSFPQGPWAIDSESRIVMDDVLTDHGIERLSPLSLPGRRDRKRDLRHPGRRCPGRDHHLGSWHQTLRGILLRFLFLAIPGDQGCHHSGTGQRRTYGHRSDRHV